MDVFFDTNRGSSFEIEVGYWDTVLDIKKKIEKYQHIPVSQQILSFQGMILQDDLEVEHSQILHNSRLQLFLPNDQNEQPPLPSTPTGDNGEELSSTNNDQVLPTQPSPPLNNLVEQKDVPDAAGSSNHNSQEPETEQSGEQLTKVQDSPVKIGRSSNKNDQMLQTHQSPPLKNSAEEKDLPANCQVSSQSPESESVKEIINIPDSPVKKSSNKRKGTMDGRKNANKGQALETEQPPQLNLGEQLNEVQDLAAKAGRRRRRRSNKNDQVPETEKSPISNSNKGTTKGKPRKRPVKWMPIAILVSPHSSDGKPAKKIAVYVYLQENVKELRQKLVKMEEEGKLKLPEEGYFLMNKHNVINEDLSFLQNDIDPIFAIEIVPRNVTSGSDS